MNLVQVIIWYLITLLIGWVNLPLTFAVFRRLRSRGYAFARPLGLLIWGFIYWLAASLKLLTPNLAGEVTALLVLAVINILVARKTGLTTLRSQIQERKKTILWMEAVFVVAFGFMALVRAANPDIIYTEKFMEMAFINAILKSPAMPPHDPWLAGYGISYYYFGYLLVAMLTRLSGAAASVAYNLTSATWFGLTALASNGLLFELFGHETQAAEADGPEKGTPHWVYFAALAAPVMLLIVSNWYGALDVLNARGLFWQEAGGAPNSTFWSWLNLRELTSPPAALSWLPARGGWSWWAASRTLQDSTLSGAAIEVIDEFPFFTYLLADIHPHMLAMPFVLLAISQALNAFWGGWSGHWKLFKWDVPLNPLTGIVAVLTLGGIAFLNTWDFPFYLVLIAAALCLHRYQQLGSFGSRVKEFFIICIVGGVLSIAAYLPFYLSFASQAGGIIPSAAFFTPGKNFWVMFGPLLVPVLAFLFVLFLKEKKNLRIAEAFLWVAAVFLGLLAASFGLTWLAGRLPQLAPLLLGLQGADSLPGLISGALAGRLRQPGTAVTLFLLLFLALSLLLRRKQPGAGSGPVTDGRREPAFDENHIFVILLIILGGLLTLAPEFVYLRDQFGTRMNTIFKFYFQAWILWSMAGSYALVWLFRHARKLTAADRIIPTILIVGSLALFIITHDPGLNASLNANLGPLGSSPLDYLVIALVLLFIVWVATAALRRDGHKVMALLALAAVAGGLIYPALELWNKTEGFQPASGFSLDGRQDFLITNPGEMAAAEWLAKAPLGVMVEAVSPTGGSYTTYNIISTFSGMPTVLGWVGHEAQWRGGYTEIGSRQAEIQELYSTRDWESARLILDKYNIRYVVVGPLEYSTYALEEDKFQQHMILAFEQDGTRIYQTVGW